MMDSNDNLQNRLDRIGRWKIFDIDWAYLRDQVALSLVDLCALSVGVDPEYARLVRGMTTTDPDNIPKPEEIAELAGYRNEAIEKWERRVRVALNHVAAGTLPIVRNAAPLGGHDPYAAIPDDAEKIVVKAADFVAWATALPVPWELPEEMKRMGPYPEAEEGLQAGSGGDKALGKREQDTLLTIIAALCDYSAIKHDDRGAAMQIAKLTEELGADVSDDTVRRWLRMIPDALASRMK